MIGANGVLNQFGGLIDPESLTVHAGGKFTQLADGEGDYTVGVFNSGNIIVTNAAQTGTLINCAFAQ